MRQDKNFISYKRIIHWACFALILIIALYLRVKFVQSVSHEMSPDAVNYSKMAQQLIEKGFYGYNSTTPNAYVTPGYPLFVAINYIIAEKFNWDPLVLTRYVQILLSMCTLVMIYGLTRKLAKNGIVALLAVFVTAIYPPFVWANGAVLTEVLGTFFLMGYLLWQLYAMDSSSRRHSLISGILMGLTVLVRPEFLPVIFVLYALRWWQQRDRRVWIMLLWSLLGIVLVLSPWWIRNAVTLHEFIPLATQTNPLMAGSFPYNNYEDNMVDRNGKTDMEFTKERLIFGFTHYPRLFLWWYTFGKLEYLYSNMYHGGGHAPLYQVILSSNMLHDAIVWFGAAAILISFLRLKEQKTMLAAVIIIMSLIRLAFVPEYRYNFSLMPLFIVLASTTGYQIYCLMRNRNERKTE
ncbi:Dolichyl-phosphate-mannose-protein mannosyltransferase [Paenibacillus tianmuensis]|uniref:Dolichyl-phosphate-mannose-protein mannosyltransferase n=1 Tax=Paenibacillus tianmuensis TaxID=624147 RepID=A0A1G4R554_9BACL|nr:glycosyltransferase family 39 protein [Paenibacillus tianmuensis]SCW51916.1 Dolichyl-phosphate-mannose-protein mannosyltransferase [Paenibacillus tianmuensis]